MVKKSTDFGNGCVHENASVEMGFQPVLGNKWSSVNCLDNARCVVTGSRVDADGTVHATVRAVRQGYVDITAMLSPTTDPHGPATREWTLHLHIVASPIP